MARMGVSDLPREIRRRCLRQCASGEEVIINPEYMRQERKDAHVTLSQAASSCGISRQHMSRMERGDETFQRGYAEICERFYARRMRSGEAE